MSLANSTRPFLQYHRRPFATNVWQRLQTVQRRAGTNWQTSSSTQYEVCSAQYSVLSTEHSVLGTGGAEGTDPGQQPFAEEEPSQPPLGWPEADALLEKFRGWLGDTRDEVQAAILAGAADRPEEFGLVDLVREFTALRHEVKLQTKSARGLDEQVAGAISALESAGSAMEDAGRQFRAVRPKETEAARRAAQPLILNLADLDEALGRSAAAMDAARRRLQGELADAHTRQLAESYERLPRLLHWACREWYTELCRLHRAQHEAQMAIIDSLCDGYAMVRKRLERSMAKRRLSRIATLGLPVDPQSMTVVEAVDAADAPGYDPGTVVEEIRPGYRWNGRVVRYAEVRAVREAASPRGEND